jgi:hypothetical protein
MVGPLNYLQLSNLDLAPDMPLLCFSEKGKGVGISGTIFWYILDSGWIASLTPLSAYNGALFNLPPYTVLDGVTGLPAGLYLLGFAVDDDVNGILELKWFDTVDMTVE